MALVNIERFSETSNFWESNEQMKFMKPYNELYKADKSKDKGQSSKDMWTIAIMEDPDPSNIFYRIPKEDRLKMLIETYNPKFDQNNKLIKQCWESFPEDNFDTIEKAFKQEIDSLVKRAKFLSGAEYTFDDVEKDEKGKTIFVAGKPMVKKGTATELDKMRANTLKIYEQYDQVKTMFEKNKSSARVHGGRKESLSERQLL